MKDPLTYTPIDTGRKGIDSILVVEFICNLLEFFGTFFL
jgi:hypothetical protein